MHVQGSNPSKVYQNLGYEEKTYGIWERITALALGILGALTVVGLFFPAVRKQFTIAFMGRTAEPIAVKNPQTISNEAPPAKAPAVSPAKTSQHKLTDKEIESILFAKRKWLNIPIETVKQGAEFIMTFMKQYGEAVPATDIKLTGTSSLPALRLSPRAGATLLEHPFCANSQYIIGLEYLLLTDRIGCSASYRTPSFEFFPIIHCDLNVTRMEEVNPEKIRFAGVSTNKQDCLRIYAEMKHVTI